MPHGQAPMARPLHRGTICRGLAGLQRRNFTYKAGQKEDRRAGRVLPARLSLSKKVTFWWPFSRIERENAV